MADKVIPIVHKKKQKQKRKKKKQSSRFLVGLVVVTILLTTLLFFILNIAKIKDVVVSGNVHYTKSEILEMIQIQENSNMMDVFFNQQKNYTNYPYIKSVEIDYNGFDKLHVTVTEKEVVSYISYQGQYLALDKNGYIIGYQDLQQEGVPVVEGLYVQSAMIGSKLDIESKVMEAILELHHLRIKYEVPITMIEFPMGDQMALNIYVNQIKIELGPAKNLDMKMKNAGEVMKKLPYDSSGTLNLQEDGEQFIFKKNKN